MRINQLTFPLDGHTSEDIVASGIQQLEPPTGAEVCGNYTIVVDDSSSFFSLELPAETDSGSCYSPSNASALSSSNSEHSGSSQPCEPESPVPPAGTQHDILVEYLVSLLQWNLPRCSHAIPGKEPAHTEPVEDMSDEGGTTSAGYTTVKPGYSQSLKVAIDTLPMVLAEMEFLRDESYNISTSIANTAYAGVYHNAGNLECEALCFTTGMSYHKSVVRPTRAFDIDSILAFPSSLAVARNGISVCFTPGQYRNIDSDLHIDVPFLGHRSNGPGPRLPQTIAIRKVPHFHLGHLYGQNDYTLYVLFLNLIDPTRKSNFLTGYELERFMDNIMLPALYSSCPASLLQHLPGSFEQAHLASSVGVTGMPGIPNSGSEWRKPFFYTIPSRYLASIWDTILQLVLTPGLHDYGQPQIFINAKNLKLGCSGSDLEELIPHFMTSWNRSCDMSFLTKENLWIDIGSEFVHDKEATQQDRHDIMGAPSGLEKSYFMFFWRQCCLQGLEASFRDLYLGDHYCSSYYTQCLSQELANLTMEPGKRHPARAHGFAYSQFYATSKEIFDCGKVYPFENPVLEILAVDPKLHDMWNNIAKQTPFNLKKIEREYATSKARAMAGLSAAENKSFGVRQEHRITYGLLSTILTHLRKQRIQPPDSFHCGTHTNMFPDSIILIPSPEMALYFLSNLNKFCFGFEYTLCESRKRGLDWENTRVMIMFLRLIRIVVKGANLSQFPAFIRSFPTNAASDLSRAGLGLVDTLTTRGYAFLPANVIDWKVLRFNSDTVNGEHFSIPWVKRLYKSRWSVIHHTTRLYDQVNQVLENLARHPANIRLRITTCLVLSCALIESFRQDVWDDLEKDQIVVLSAENSLSQSFPPLCLTTLRQVYKQDLTRFKFVQDYNRHRLHPFDRVTYLWDYDAIRNRTGWEAKPWRHKAYRWETNAWQTGSPKAGYHNPEVPPQLKFGLQDISELLDCVEEAGVLHDKLEAIGRQ
ncbi:unnamed protein product [Tuber aestivum]|uniref:Uncharacterized protein n=1 Tax=Tuber aestivum TaxID=59557 RepID=A0A292PM74_9PEZI|nr:unnamed protein product [Tuber aestivum]